MAPKKSNDILKLAYTDLKPFLNSHILFNSANSGASGKTRAKIVAYPCAMITSPMLSITTGEVGNLVCSSAFLRSSFAVYG